MQLVQPGPGETNCKGPSTPSSARRKPKPDLKGPLRATIGFSLGLLQGSFKGPSSA